MTDQQLLRYSRHVLLEGIGIEGQQRLLAAHALIVGAGGLGSPAALYLAASGVGRITIVDDDAVDLTNLQRQIMHADARVGQSKAQSARVALRAINPEIEITAIEQRAGAALLDALLPGVNIVLDCSDNYATRQAVNAACVRHGKPLVTGAAIGFDGQVTLIDPTQADAPCYACLFPSDQAAPDVACATFGVFAPLVGIVGSLQAAEALKCLCGIAPSLAGRLLMIDARALRVTEIALARDPCCPVCGGDKRAPHDG
ncbi:MAG: HesA/MoeB/ThiF family protein [Burkholderiaceae bacterium]|nr:HesA/MoeB/ThiF family protein [Burkholderiaceae bacterium]